MVSRECLIELSVFCIIMNSQGEILAHGCIICKEIGQYSLRSTLFLLDMKNTSKNV